MEVCHDEKTDDGNDNTGKFDLVIGDASSEIIGDLTIKNNNCAASN